MVKKILAGLLVLGVVAGAVIGFHLRGGQQSVTAGSGEAEEELASEEQIQEKYIIAVSEEVLAQVPPAKRELTREILPLLSFQWRALPEAGTYYLCLEDAIAPELRSRVVASLTAILTEGDRGGEGISKLVGRGIGWYSFAIGGSLSTRLADAEFIKLYHSFDSRSEFDEFLALTPSVTVADNPTIQTIEYDHTWAAGNTNSEGWCTGAPPPNWMFDRVAISCSQVDTNHTVNAHCPDGYFQCRTWNNANESTGPILFISWVRLFTVV